MPVSTCRVVLWVALLIVLPVPVYLSHWGWVPVGRGIQAMGYWGQGVGQWQFVALSLFITQLIIWSALCWGVAVLYGVWSKNWPHKIRGSVMGLVVLSTLIVFSSVGVYRPLLPRLGSPLTFLQVYEPELSATRG
jgi:hypothetical protein